MRYERGCIRERKIWRTPFKKKDKERGRGVKGGIGTRLDERKRERDRDTKKAVALDH